MRLDVLLREGLGVNRSGRWGRNKVTKPFLSKNSLTRSSQNIPEIDSFMSYSTVMSIHLLPPSYAKHSI